MSRSALAADRMAAERVAAWLEANPRFLLDHPEVLASQQLHDDHVGAVSLVERQLALLREENARLHARIDSLTRVAEANQQLAARVHALVLALIGCHRGGAVVAELERRLREDFDADAARLVIGRDGAPPAGGLFDDLWVEGRPRCGRLARAQHEALFGDALLADGSAALVPVGGDGWYGILAVASRDPLRYRPEMAVDLLTFVGAVASAVLARCDGPPGGPA